MRNLSADVVVIGGGATGVGVARDAAMRGWSVILVDRADLAQGTSGRFHGLLHSGGRYVVSDPESARECAAENAIVTRIHPDAVETTGGLFVTLPGDDETYADGFLAAAAACGVPAAEVRTSDVLRREPRLNPGIGRAFEVADAAVDGWAMVWGAARSAMACGAQVLTYHRVTSITAEQGRVTGVVCRDERHGEDVRISCGFVLSCAGAWAGQVAALAGAHGVEVVPGRGLMIAMNHRLVGTVVNHCQPPGDGDILVPVHTVSIIGTTDVPAPDPDRLTIEPAEVQQMLDAGERLVPGFREARALHAWVGARPLVRDTRVAPGDTRHMGRGMAIIDHAERDGLAGFLTISGGKLTTYRLMAERLVDAMAAQLGQTRPCRTAEEPVEPERPQHTYVVTHRLAEREADRLDEQILCECELLDRGRYQRLLDAHPDASLDDLRRQLRLGMGPCQGGFCAARAAGIACGRGVVDAAAGTERLRTFVDHRWIGLWPILHGTQARQAALDAWLLDGALDLAHAGGGDE